MPLYLTKANITEDGRVKYFAAELDVEDTETATLEAAIAAIRSEVGKTPTAYEILSTTQVVDGQFVE